MSLLTMHVGNYTHLLPHVLIDRYVGHLDMVVVKIETFYQLLLVMDHPMCPLLMHMYHDLAYKLIQYDHRKRLKIKDEIQIPFQFDSHKYVRQYGALE